MKQIFETINAITAYEMQTTYIIAGILLVVCFTLIAMNMNTERHEGFTPGKWNISDQSDLYIVQKDGPEEYAICEMHTAWDKVERKANAKLIAAAPELLKQVEELTKVNEELKERIEKDWYVVSLREDSDKLKKRIAELECLLIAALPIIHDYSLSGIEDRERRIEIGTFEQEVKRALKN
jgi:hypothetical protein